MLLSKSSVSNINDHWSQTMNRIIILQDLPKCDTETLKWADAVGKMAPTCLTESCHKASICKKKKKRKIQYLQRAVKWSTVKQDMPM